MSLKIVILGSGAALPTALRNPTSQYVECLNRHILIDCGEGTQHQIRKAGIKLQKISIILISHLHGDHYFGLVGLLSTMHLLGRDKGIVVYGPDGLEDIIRSQLEIGGQKLSFSITFVKLPKEFSMLFQDKGIEIMTFPLKHKIPTNGFIIREKPKERRIIKESFEEDKVSLLAIPFFRRGEDYLDENGVCYSVEDYTYLPPKSNSYAYCSDTAYDESLIPYINNASLLYHEATFVEKDKDKAIKTFHSTAKEAAIIAAKSNVERLLLGHLSARYETSEIHLIEAKQLFDNVVVVNDLDEFHLL